MKKFLYRLCSAAVLFSSASTILAEECKINTFNPPSRPLPFSFSVPLKKGSLTSLTSLANLRITDNGQSLPVQSRVLTKWPDSDSIRWCRITVPATDSKELFLEVNPKTEKTVDVKNPVSSEIKEKTVTISNKVMSLIVDTASLTADYHYGNEGFGLMLSEVFNKEGQLQKTKTTGFEIIERGPLKTSLRIKGFHYMEEKRGSSTFDIFISVYADTPVVEITHVIGFAFENPLDGHAVEMMDTGAVNVVFNFAGAGTAANLSSLDNKKVELADNSRIVQWEDNSYEDASSSVNEGRLDGVLTRALPQNTTFFIALTDFWQQYPKGFEYNKNSIRLELFSAITPSERYKGRENEHIWYYYLKDGFYKVRQGVEKSHTFYTGILPGAKRKPVKPQSH